MLQILPLPFLRNLLDSRSRHARRCASLKRKKCFLKVRLHRSSTAPPRGGIVVCVSRAKGGNALSAGFIMCAALNLMLMIPVALLDTVHDGVVGDSYGAISPAVLTLRQTRLSKCICWGTLRVMSCTHSG